VKAAVSALRVRLLPCTRSRSARTASRRGCSWANAITRRGACGPGSGRSQCRQSSREHRAIRARGSVAMGKLDAWPGAENRYGAAKISPIHQLGSLAHAADNQKPTASRTILVPAIAAHGPPARGRAPIYQKRCLSLLLIVAGWIAHLRLLLLVIDRRNAALEDASPQL
jgi:hypothetical protein